jgi:hypothetical protein
LQFRDQGHSYNRLSPELRRPTKESLMPTEDNDLSD